jgi:sterol desaturase/sphingolipid hydroxylase (fatty acid hydroxylase superfamily)
MSANDLALIAGVIISLGCAYIPGLAPWYDGLESVHKRLIMLGLLVVVAGVSYGLACLGWGAAWGISIPCDQAGAQALIVQLIIAIIANQSTYMLAKGLRPSYALAK